MNFINARLNNVELVEKAERIINNFIEGDKKFIYVVNPDGSTFKIQKGCTLLTIDHSHMPEYVKEM